MNSTNERSGKLSGGAWGMIGLGLAVIAAFGLRTISNATFWLHLAGGRWIAQNGVPKVDALSYTGAGNSWVNPTWLYDRLLYGLWGMGESASVIIVHVALLVVAFLLLSLVARRWAGGISIALTLVLCGWLIAPRFVIGAPVLALFIAAVFVYVLATAKKTWVPWAVLVPLQLLWTNVHDSFLLGPIIVVIYAIEVWVRVRAAEGTPDESALKKQATSLSGLMLAALVLTLANPYVAQLHRHVLVMAQSSAHMFTREWISPFSSQFAGSIAVRHLLTLSLFLGAGGLLTERSKLPIAITTLAVVSAFFVVWMLWYLDFFAVLAFPFLALSLRAIGDFIKTYTGEITKRSVDVLPKVAAVVTIIVAILSLGAVVTNAYHVSTGGVSSFGLGAEHELFPNAAAKVMERPDFPEKIINSSADGAYLLWKQPDRKVFIDPRAGVHGSEIYRALANSVAGVDESWKGLVDRWDPGAIVLNCCQPGAAPMARRLLEQGHWVLGYFDGATAILLRESSANEAIAKDLEVQKEGLALLERERKRYASKLGGMGTPGNSPRLVGAGNFYMALGRYSEAQTVYALLTRGTPSMAGAWMNLGVAETQLGNFTEAERALTQAAKIMPKNVWPWLYLSKAYSLSGNPQGESHALDEGRKINPAAVSAFLEMGGDSAAAPPGM